MKLRSVLLLSCLLASLPSAAATPGSAELDAFDASMRTARLPNGITLAYTERGPRDGVPVVMIHGFTNNARNWAGLAPLLDPSLHLILVDARGHGHSSRPECCYTRIDMAYDVKLLMDQLHIPSAHLIGHSMGSLIAQMLAETWPERIRRVVLIGSTGGSRSSCEANGPARPPLQGMREALLKLKDPLDPNSQFMNGWYGGRAENESEASHRQRRDAAAIPIRVWLAVIDQAGTGMDIQGGLTRFKAPALLIWGDKDTLMPEQVRCSLREALPQAQVHVFPAYGHNPFWDDPQAVAALINPFLRAAAP